MDESFRVTGGWQDGIYRMLLEGRLVPTQLGAISGEIFRLLAGHRPERALVDARVLQGRPSTFETYDGVRAYPPRPFLPRRLAVLDLSAHREFFVFHEDASANVGVPLKYFTDEAAALAWLNSPE